MSTAKNRRILLVDDTPAIHEDFRKILAPAGGEGELADYEALIFGAKPRASAQGFRLDSAFQGQEGLARVKEALEKDEPYAVAFVDMRMPPGWDGVETIERLWEADPRLQVVICTAYSDYSWEEVLERLEVGDRLLVLKKPFDAIEVCQLSSTLTSKWEMTRQAELKMAALEEAVQRRTEELAQANHALQTDLVERKRAQQEAMEAYRRMSDILEFLPDATFVVDAQGRIIAWNHATEKMTGVRKEEVLGHDDFAHGLTFHGMRRKTLIDMLDEEPAVQELHYPGLRREGKTLTAEARVMLRGEVCWLWSAAAPLYNMQGEKVGGIQTLRDVTQQRRSEQERSRLEAQLQHTAMIESLMAQLGHDLKTPLTPLSALLPIIRRKVDDPGVWRILDICQQSVGQIENLSDKALELVRLSCSQTALEATPVALKAAVDNCLNGCRSLFVRRGISCLNEVDEGVIVQAAGEQLNLLMDNLLSNAARFAREEGTVCISTRIEGDTVVVSVQDDGVGLQPGQSAQIFDEFFKADSARQDVNTQGLGLAISRRIVQNHRGRIWAESPGEGLGATIHFTLRLWKKPLQRSEARA